MATKIENVAKKDVLLQIKDDSFKDNDGKEQAFTKLLVTVDVEGEATEISLKSEGGLKKSQLIKRIRSGKKVALCANAKTFKKKVDGVEVESTYYFLYVNLDIPRYPCTVKINIAGAEDTRLERYFVLKAMGIDISEDTELDEVE